MFDSSRTSTDFTVINKKYLLLVPLVFPFMFRYIFISSKLSREGRQSLFTSVVSKISLGISIFRTCLTEGIFLSLSIVP